MNLPQDPECEVHSIEEKIQDSSGLEKSSLSLPAISSSSENCTFQDECRTKNGHMYTSSSGSEESNWNEQIQDPNMSLDSSEKDDDSNSGSSFLFPKKLPKDCNNHSVLSDDEKDYFSIPVFDATLDTDDDSTFCLDLEGTDSDILSAVNEIRREAEQMDTILVLDQLKTLQSEMSSVTKRAGLNCVENENLKIKLQDSEDQVAQLKLERDLNQADVTKLQDDLKTVVSKMFDISLYDSMQESHTSEACSTKENRTSLHTNEQISPRSEKIRIVGLADPAPARRRRDVTCRSHLLNDTNLGLNNVHPRSPVPVGAYSDHIHRMPSRGRQPLPHRDQNIFRIRNHHTAQHQRAESVRVDLLSMGSVAPKNIIHKVAKNNFQRRRHRSLSIDSHASTRLIMKTKDEDAGKKKMCRLFRRRSSKNHLFSTVDEFVMKHQILKLREMMKTSLAASEKLRRRIATITKYYEGIISKLQAKVVEVKTEKSKAEIEMRMLVSKLEFKLRRKDEEIVRLKAKKDNDEIWSL